VKREILHRKNWGFGFSVFITSSKKRKGIDDYTKLQCRNIEPCGVRTVVNEGK